MKFGVIIEKDDDGYVAFCPAMKGCHTQGESLEEVLENMKEAVALYLETLSPEEKSHFASKEILAATMEIGVA